MAEGNIFVREANGSVSETQALGAGTTLDPKRSGFFMVDPATGDVLHLDDSYGKKVMPIHIEHPHDDFFNCHIHYETTTVQALTADAVANTYTLQVADSSGFAPPCKLCIEDTINCEGDHINVISQNAGIITLARPLDKGHLTGVNVRKVLVNMAVNGSVTPVSFVFRPLLTDCIVHVETINWYIKTPNEAADSLFGGGPELTRGIHIREVRGATPNYRTIGTFRKNQRFRVYDYQVINGDRANPSDSYWLWAKINLREQNDGIIRLAEADGDYLEVRIQDDLSIAAYDEIECIVGGHLEI